jgi:indole-3-glycerol phosphate synthase
VTDLDLLGTIVAATRRAVEVRQGRTPVDVLHSRITEAPRGRDFVSALRSSEPPRIIAECKRRSPSRGILRRDYDPAAHAAAYASAGAAAISVLTEPTFFDGALEHLATVRAATDVPLLRKDFIVTEYQIVEAAAFGADAVLLIAGALPDRELARLIEFAGRTGTATLVEVHDREELQRAIDSGAQTIGVNSRNLRTLAVHLPVLDELIELIPDEAVAVAESGIRSDEDISRLSRFGYDAFLIGEHLITQPDPGAALMKLRGRIACA